MKRRLILALALASLGIGIALAFRSSTNEPEAEAVLKAQGYTDVELTGYRGYRCGNDDSCTGFRARRDGAVVTGAVGCVWYQRACLVKLDVPRQVEQRP